MQIFIELIDSWWNHDEQNLQFTSSSGPKTEKNSSLMSLFCLVMIWSQNGESSKFTVIWIFLGFLEFEQICNRVIRVLIANT